MREAGSSLEAAKQAAGGAARSRAEVDAKQAAAQAELDETFVLDVFKRNELGKEVDALKAEAKEAAKALKAAEAAQERAAQALEKEEAAAQAAATAAAGEGEQTKAEAAKVVGAAEKQTADAVAEARGRAKALTAKADKEADALLRQAKKLLK